MAIALALLGPHTNVPLHPVPNFVAASVGVFGFKLARALWRLEPVAARWLPRWGAAMGLLALGLPFVLASDAERGGALLASVIAVLLFIFGIWRITRLVRRWAAWSAGAGVVLALVACAPAPIQVAVLRGPIGERINQFVRDSLPSFSGQILVARDGSTVLHQAYGPADRESARPNSVETVFDIGSVTKQFTAAAILACRGRPAVRDEHPWTVLSGGPCPQVRTQSPHAAHAFDRAVAVLRGRLRAHDGGRAWLDTVSLEFTLGERFRYSNPGYSVLALVAEVASGRPFEEFLQSRLLRPAGLHETGYRAPPWEPRNWRWATR